MEIVGDTICEKFMNALHKVDWTDSTYVEIRANDPDHPLMEVISIYPNDNNTFDIIISGAGMWNNKVSLVSSYGDVRIMRGNETVGHLFPSEWWDIKICNDRWLDE